MKFIMMVLISMILTACSKQPNEKDIRKALEVSVQEENNRIKQMIVMLKQEEKTEVESKKPTTTDESLNASVNEVLDKVEQMRKAVKATLSSASPDLELMIYELVDVKKLGDCEQQKDSINFKCKVKATVKNKAGEVANTIDISLVRAEGGEWVILYDDETENKAK
jgi:hypothetical protein